jgi:starvation-inducible outer membrane lipoprotein
MRRSAPIAAASLLFACNMGTPPEIERERPPAPVTPPKPAPARFGQPITEATITPLERIAKEPTAWRGKTVTTTGKVVAVCQEQGCWMEIRDGAGDANVRMHAHSFFVPRTSHGKRARVQGTVVLVKDGRECEDMNATGATLQLDATGVELLD